MMNFGGFTCLRRNHFRLHLRAALLEGTRGKADTTCSFHPNQCRSNLTHPPHDTKRMTMFHPGDLNSAISLAISQNKPLLCFIRADNDEDSDTWEHNWLPFDQGTAIPFGERLGRKAVMLKIDFGSKKAGFLGAFCTIEKAPTIVVIRNGQVLEKVEGAVDAEEWEGRLRMAVGLPGADVDEDEDEETEGEAEEGVDERQEHAAEIANASIEENARTQAEEPAQAPQASSSSSQPPLQSSSQPQQDFDALFPDRSSRLEADATARRAAEKASRVARQEARRKEAEEAYEHHKGSDKGKQRATSASDSAEKQKARNDWIYQQKQRKEEAKKERERILRQIEADKAERKARTQRAKEAEVEAGAGMSSPLPESRVAADRRSAGAGGVCSLQIRLFDGSSIRNRFPSSSTTLAKGVREWIKDTSPPGSGGADIPYNFRQILAPQPSRSIEVSEEHQTLSDLGLVPNATLVLVPISGSVSAYTEAGGSGVMGYGYNMFSSAYNLLPSVSYYLPSFSRLYLGGTGDPQEASNVQGARMAGADITPADEAPGRVRVKTLADQRAEAAKKQKTEFYNGNSLGFEGRKDDDEGLDKK